MNMNNLLSHLVSHENELERKRTRALARQLWGDVIDCDARIDVCKKLRKWLTDEAMKDAKQPNP